MVSILLNHVFTSLKLMWGWPKISCVMYVLVDFVLVVFLDDVVVALHNICCGCV